jgi:hypothetical protein
VTIIATGARDGGECHDDDDGEPELFRGSREWQKEAFTEYFRQPRRDFLLVATPGAGKTAWALTVAARLLARQEIAAITVVTPTEHLKYQWARAADAFGVSLDPGYRNAQGRVSAAFTGVAVTYAQVAAHPALHRQRTLNRPTLVVFDEIHHAGDALSWGEAVRDAFEPSAWSPREWTSRGSPWGCTRRASAPRCSSPRRSAGSSGPGGAARPPRCSCRPSPPCSGTPPNWRPNAITCWRRPATTPGNAISPRHAVIHSELRRTCGGPALAQATAAQIRARIDTIRRWAAPR